MFPLIHSKYWIAPLECVFRQADQNHLVQGEDWSIARRWIELIAIPQQNTVMQKIYNSFKLGSSGCLILRWGLQCLGWSADESIWTVQHNAEHVLVTRFIGSLVISSPAYFGKTHVPS